MRTLAILLVISCFSLAQDDGGAALFYKGFWLEQAEGKLDEAAAFYGKLLADKPDAPEAPRALLGLVRIKVAKGEDASELVAELERRYPAAKEEIAGARRIAVREEFDPEHRPGDSPVAEKLKSLLKQGAWTDADRLFLVDLGSAAHPMLARLLRATADGHVWRATDVLVAQRTQEAYAVLAAALLDDTALFRSTIVKELRGLPEAPPVVIDALAKLFERSAARLRAEIVDTLVPLASHEGRERAFAVLTRALADGDESVRVTALGAVWNTAAPDAYLEALLRLVESGDAAEPGFVATNLLRFADRATFRDRIEKIVEARTLEWDALPSPLPDEGAIMLARTLVKGHLSGRPVSRGFVTRAAQESPRAAALLVMAAVESGVDDFVPKLSCVFMRRHLGEEADKVRTAAIEAAEGIGEARQPNADREVLEAVDVTEQDFPSIVEGLRRRGERSFPSVLLRKEWLRALGPGKAGALVEFCRSESEVQALLIAGRDFAQRDDGGADFFRAVLPRVGPGAVGELRALVARPALIALVADRLLSAQGPEWGWDAQLQHNGAWFMVGRTMLSHDQAALKYPGPYVWRAVALSGSLEVRAKLLGHVGDKRFAIAVSAASAAAAEKSEAGTEALKRALDSEIPAARAIALEALADRVADGRALVRGFASRPDLSLCDRDAVAGVMLKGPAYAPLAAELLRLGTWPNLWPVYQEIAPKECVALALAEAVLDRDGDHRLGAVRVLTQAEDPRRIEVFRVVLRGTDRPVMLEVLTAVRDQYLVELGEETLAQLRSPDESIRATATDAIDKLKFYAEAKKAFEK